MNETVSIIEPLHVKVPGRARFKIKGLRGSDALKSALEAGLIQHRGIHGLSASTLTGNLIVYFSPDRKHAQIAQEITVVLDRWFWSRSSADIMPPSENLKSIPQDLRGETRLPEDIPWHLLNAKEVFEQLQVSSETGLTFAAAHDRLQEKGPNILKQHQARTSWRIFFEQFHSLPLLLLAAEAVLAIFSGALLEAAAVGGIVAANTALGYLIDWRTQHSLLSAKRVKRPAALVIRDGRTCQIAGDQLVPGDLLVLKPGTYVGADSRIFAADNLKIDESVLTGESIPIDKTARPLHTQAKSAAQRYNMAFMGTLVVGGQGMCVVVATGNDTEYGRMQSLMVETLPPDTILTRKLDHVSRQLLRAALWIGTGAFGIGLLRGLRPLRALRAALSLTATAIPAGLPSAATANLAIGMRKLQAQKVGIQRLVTLETLGSVNMICFDKTGTITRSRISVLRMYIGHTHVGIKNRKFFRAGQQVKPLEDADLNWLIRISVLCNESRVEPKDGTHRMVLTGSPTEKALLFMGALARADIFGIYRQHSLKRVVHRGEFRRRMLTVHTMSGRKRLVSVKGDPLEVLRLCDRQLVNGRIMQLSERDAFAIESENDAMAADGLRVLGFAYRLQAGDSTSETAQDFIWVGLVGIAEPIRKGAATLMDGLHQAAMQTVMITGDQSLTAHAVANRIGLGGDRPLKSLDSSNFEAMPPEMLEALARDVQVFTRVNPSQKLQIVRAYQHAGYTVAMTGDGINDGPALRAADVGIAMGLSGTEVAREVADIVLQDDNLLNLAAAVRTSRAAQLNLKKAARYYLTANFSDTLLTLSFLAAGGAVQPTNFNIVPDMFPGLALLNEPAEEHQLSGPMPAKTDPLFSVHEFRSMALQATVLVGAALGAFTLGTLRHGTGGRAAAMAYESLTAAKLLHSGNCRTSNHQGRAGRPSGSNRWFNLTLAGSAAIQLSTLLVPGLRRLTGTAVLDLADIGICAAAAVAGLLANRNLSRYFTTKLIRGKSSKNRGKI